MKKYRLKRVLLYLSAVLILFSVISCPEPITEEVVAKVEDTGSPSIIVTSPSNNSIYRSSVTFEGRVSDDAENSIENFYFDVQNRPISGGVTISSGNVSQDASAGLVSVDYDSSSGNFSFTFSTIDPDVLTGRLFIDLTAIDWNGNTAEETVILYENTDGPYVELTKPAAGDIYSGNMDIEGRVLDFYVPSGDEISYENIKDISWRIVGTSEDSQLLTVYGQTPDGDGKITGGAGVDLIYDVDDGTIIGLLPLALQEGDVDFDFMVTDLNGHTTIKSFEISDGNVSPSVVIDTLYPQPFKGVRYFKPGDEVTFTGHVGPTNRVLDLLNYYVYPDSTSEVSISYTTVPDGDLNRFDFSTPLPPKNTSSFTETTQQYRFQCKASGSTEITTTTVLLTLDDDDPEFVISDTAVTSDDNYYYIAVDFSEPVWGAEDFSALLGVGDFSVNNTHGTLNISSIDTSVSGGGNLEDGLTKIRLIVPKTSSNIYKDGTTEYSINTAGTSGDIGIFDVANNTPSAAGKFVFPDETGPSVVTSSQSPTGTVSNYNYSGTVSFEFNEEVVNPGGASGGKIQINSSDSDVCTIAANGVDVSVSVPISELNEGSNTITVPVGRFEDISGNSNSTLYSWTVIKDTSAPETSALEVKTGSDTITDGSTRGSITNNVDVIITFTDSDIAGVSGKNIILKRGGTNVTTVGADTASIASNKATISIPAANFDTSGAYEISIDNGAFEDSYSNPCDTYTGLPFDFTLDISPPASSALEVKTGSDTITDSSTIGSITNNVEVIITFTDSDIAGVSGKNIILKRGGTNVTTVGADTASIASNKATISIPAENFDTSGAYEISIDNGAFEDSYNNPCDTYTGLPFDFTLDISPPASSALEVKTGSDTITDSSTIGSITNNVEVIITFTDSDIAGVSGKNIILKRGGTNVTTVGADTASINTGLKTATITIPAENFDTSGAYEISIDNGAFEDSYSNPCNTYTGLPFDFTLDISPPASSALEVKTGSDTITDSSTIVSITNNVEVIITFTDSDIAGVSGKNIILKRGGTNVTTVGANTASIASNKATLTILASNFDTSGAYEISIDNGAFEDSYSNPCNTYTGLPFDFTISD